MNTLLDKAEHQQNEAQLFASYGDLLTVKDLAQITSQTEQTIRAWCREGRVPSVRIGTRILIPKAQFIRLIEESCTVAVLQDSNGGKRF